MDDDVPAVVFGLPWILGAKLDWDSETAVAFACVFEAEDGIEAFEVCELFDVVLDLTVVDIMATETLVALELVDEPEGGETRAVEEE